MAESVTILTPVGRLVQGSLYKGQTTDAEGRPLIIKNGPNAGQPRVDWYFALAIPKGGEQHWAQTEWGLKIWETGHKSFPNGQAQSPTFAWKIQDGDSTVPNKKGHKPCDQEGFRGCWVLRLNSGFAPKIVNSTGTEAIQTPDAVKIGYYAQVYITVAGNDSTQQPGIYLNHTVVALAGYGPEIVTGPDPASIGFGQAPLPAGASAAPLGAAPVPVPGASVPGVPLPGVPSPSVAPPPLAASLGVVPHPGFLAGPGVSVPGMAAPPPPAPPAPPAPPPGRRMLPAANGVTYEQFIAAGWTDQTLVANGMMAA